MKRHRFDPLSFIFGMLFLLGGVPLLVSESGFSFFNADWMFPAFLVAAGVIVLATAQFTRRDRDEDTADDPFSYEDPWSG
ncbi:MAG: hypothetical protein QNJ75_09645 [Acidimicrobiia bacterium]|nr:hypothetical protein [Acidimicrobiia bacterium]